MRKSLWNGWNISEKIGEGRFGEVYKALKVVDGVTLSCAIKYVSLPKSQEELNDLVKKGIIKDVEDANNYYLKIVDDLKKEIAIMQKFNGSPYVVDCFDYIQENKFDGTGIDFYIRMELAEDIDKYFERKNVTTNDVINLGIDICSALELCESLNIIHRDIKPSNIYVGVDGKYKLGDFGIASLSNTVDNKAFGTYNYISPEVYNKKDIGFNTDLYSLGIVMYKLLNNNKLPFSSRFSTDKDILNTRMSGVSLLPIKGVDKALMDIIIKACNYEATGRYKNATEMKNALKRLSGNHNEIIEENVSNKGEKTLSIYEMDLDTPKLIEDNSGSNKLRSKIKLKGFNNNKSNGLKDKKSIKKLKKNIIKVLGIVLIIIIIILLLRSCGNTKKCNVGYVNKHGSCVKGYYYCEDGYSLNDDNKCQKVVETKEARLDEYCEENYILNGDKCVINDVKEPKSAYQCAEGFTLKDNKCLKEEKMAASISYSCPNDYTLAGQTCIKILAKDASVSYSCSKGTLSGKTCNYTENNSSYIVTNSSCPSGYSDDRFNYYPYQGKCCKQQYLWMPPECVDKTETKSCSTGTYKNGTCVINRSTAANENYSCPSGYELVLNQCVKTEEVKPNVKSYCASGFTLKGNYCIASVSVDAIKGYTCDKGYIFTGTSCVANNTVDPTKKYSCSRKYTLNGDKCEKYDVIKAKVKYEK